MAGRSASAPPALASPAPLPGPRRLLAHAQLAWPADARLLVFSLPFASAAALYNGVRLAFNRFGTNSVSINLDQHGRPYAIVQYERAVDAMDAETSEIFVGGRRVIVKFAGAAAFPRG